jgi:hypothetical protein
MPAFPHFIGGSGQTQSPRFNQERTVNWFVEQAQSAGATSQMALLPTPGFSSWGTSLGDVSTRAMTFVQGRLFALIGAGFYEFDVNGTPTKRGTVAIGSTLGQFADNGLIGGQLLMASGGNAYCFTLATNTFAQVLTGGVTMIAYCQGFFLSFNVATGKVNLSNLNDGTTWNAGTFFQRSLFPDPWQAMFVDGNGLIWLPGLESFEVWYNTGAPLQPFAPLSGLVGPYGIAAPFAFSVRPQPIWLSQTPEGAGLVVAFSGSSGSAISTYAVDTAFAMYSRTVGISNTEALSYQDSGHTFLVLNVPNAGATWALDVEKPSWSERGQWNSLAGTYGLWAPRVHSYAFGKQLVGDRTTGTIWSMDSTIATDVDGKGIRRLRRSPMICQENARIPYDRLELLMDTGIGNASAPDPQMMLRVSTNGGMTWGNQRIAGLGAQGVFGRRVYWNRLGANPQTVVEVSVSDPVLPRIVDAWVNPQEAAA